jgi:hypothetical protein
VSFDVYRQPIGKVSGNPKSILSIYCLISGKHRVFRREATLCNSQAHPSSASAAERFSEMV